MSRIPLLTALLLTLLGSGFRSDAFSLLGPLDGRYQNATIGYNPYGFDIGGPMNLGEEYRWNLPSITYGFDKSFADYFGQQGIDAVERAIQILNELPAMSQMSTDLTEFPIEGAKRTNFRAAALGLIDLRSMALGMLLEELGVAGSTRYTWTLRDRRVIANIPQYLVIMRNFDPVTWQYSPYVNDTLYSYRIVQLTAQPEVYDAFEVPIDPVLASLRTPVSAIVENIFSAGAGFNGLGAGEYFVGLTRDDAGALRYLYRGLNVNGENFAPGSVLSTTFVGGGGTGGNSVIIGAGQTSPWDDPFGFTNLIFTNLVVGTNNITNAPITPTAVDAALRSGIDKIRFLRVNADSTFGGTFSFTNRFTDTFITNGVILQQVVERAVTIPDIIFSADDLPLDAGGGVVFYTRSGNFDNNRDLNSALGGNTFAGPGVITPSVNITFNKIGPFRYHLDAQPFLSGIDLSEAGFGAFAVGTVWGSFDGSTNAPVIFPNGASIQLLEQQVLGR